MDKKEQCIALKVNWGTGYETHTPSPLSRLSAVLYNLENPFAWQLRFIPNDTIWRAHPFLNCQTPQISSFSFLPPCSHWLSR